jgi:ketosteroid isomerase-like protein
MREGTMGATTPQQWWEIWAESFEKGDVERIIRLYDPEATVVPNPGNPIRGMDTLRETLRSYVDMNGTMEAEQKEIVHGPGVATSYIEWSFDADLPGEPLHLEATATVVLAERPDGWVALIDDFFSQG